MDLSLTKLRQLLTVARCGSFSRAAVELNISQPALSRSIAAIEQRYGFPIFNRLGHGIEPTSAGAQVIAQAQPLLQSMHVFDNNMRLMGSGEAGQLALGMTPLLASQLLAAFAGDLFGPASQVQLRVLIRPGEHLLSALKDDAIELFFYPESHVTAAEEVDVEPVGRIVPACVVRAGHPLAAQVRVTLADLSRFPWGSSVEPPHEPELPVSARLICDNYHVLREAVLTSDLVCICSRDFVAPQLADGSLRAISVEGMPLPPASIHMARLRGRIHSPLALVAIGWIRHALAAGKLAS
ncbi:LysR family transcriptional regulator [Novosphingobium album (ex Liu et al. 2023)]|uniref:LysR family transcriptional regulator n=1 Tax=Novosphingobium album (ex Liu et al. 2023) TaxID=3031130 RepID=A0ABT5WVX2_9SPHN|nr:LysR family transcriptional regulator [Novosphingobium album (ex Liu et al. 2023)]MDE8654054.1 LysR family transcriptional regulator [Novosphingobium album (ex Liu et al. 2023)]